VGSLRREIQAIDPKLIVTVIAPVRQDVERALVRERLLARLSGCFGALAAALAAIGLYGLMAHAVASRTREIGIRMALGAPRGRVLRTEVWSALRLVAIGIAVGVPAAMAGGRLIAAQLFGVAASDPVTLAAAAGLMTLLAGVAAYGPAWRASRVDPMLALRNQ
jgi:ABC-type antimicrobial peptide transport system permease subunit